MKKRFCIWTIGHSNRPIETFVGLLKAHGIQSLIDARTIPKSRHNPQFNKEALAKTLRKRGIGYRHMKGLGGLRRAKPDSVNQGWKNASFRGYADYMQTEQFEENLNKLIDLAKHKTVAVMCAEAVPWRCHRSLIADALAARKIHVFHIMNLKTAKKHSMKRSFMPTPVVKGGKIRYPNKERAKGALYSFAVKSASKLAICRLTSE